MTLNEKFLADYRKRAVGILKSTIADIECGYDPIGSSGSIVMALADVHAGKMLVDEEIRHKNDATQAKGEAR